MTGFLLARIAEDEAVAREPQGYLYAGPLSRTFDPERVLAECEAKRRIVWTSYERGDSFDIVIRLLAGTYADHSDYREEWKP